MFNLKKLSLTLFYLALLNANNVNAMQEAAAKEPAKAIRPEIKRIFASGDGGEAELRPAFFGKWIAQKGSPKTLSPLGQHERHWPNLGIKSIIRDAIIDVICEDELTEEQIDALVEHLADFLLTEKIEATHDTILEMIHEGELTREQIDTLVEKLADLCLVPKRLSPLNGDEWPSGVIKLRTAPKE